MIMEKVTGNPRHEEVERRIGKSLGLSRTVWAGRSTGVPRPRANGYLPAAQQAELMKTVRAAGQEPVWSGARYGLGIGSRPLSCGGRSLKQEKAAGDLHRPGSVRPVTHV
jgi:D-alanyl-D-alanine carboxypeptidase